MEKKAKNKKNRVPFSLRLFWSVFSIFLGFTVCFLLFQYQREREFVQEKLNNILNNYNHQLFRRSQQNPDIQQNVYTFLKDIPQKDLRITIIDPSGKVLFDNSQIEELTNHNDRSEVQKARRQQEGFAIRTSGSNGIRYFYSATNINGYIYRSALPYDPFVDGVLTINKDFIYFMAFMTLLFFFVLSKFTFSIGKTISKLRDFARNAEKGKKPEVDYAFPNDELGDISQNIIQLYSQQQEARFQLNSQREEESRIKRQLTQNVAHELKTPVSSIQGYLETIITNPDLPPEKQKHFLERCYSQSTRLTDLLNDISVLNRLDEASNMFDLSEINIAHLIAEIERECSKNMEEKHITTEVTLPGNPTIYGNQSLLYSIFRNLYDNAIMYAGENIRITIDCYHEDPDYYHFSFSDNGIGISEEHIHRIFERFYRIDKGRSRKVGGTGLGLSIVKNGVHFHQGQISAQSSPGQGITFHFTLKKRM